MSHSPPMGSCFILLNAHSPANILQNSSSSLVLLGLQLAGPHYRSTDLDLPASITT